MTSELDPALDHVALSVADRDRARDLYRAPLRPLDLVITGARSDEQTGTVACVGLGRGRAGSRGRSPSGPQTPRTHICFRAPSLAADRALHAAGLAAGGQDGGPPGVRELYHPAYDAAFVRDPEGHPVEAVPFAPAP